MKKLIIALFVSVLGVRGLAMDGHAHHAKHGMLLFGSSEIFASHIVYKSPHNYQVVLGLDLPDGVREIYLQEKNDHPDSSFQLMLDAFDIAEIARQTKISGTLYRREADDRKIEIVPRVELPRASYRVLYFDELPLSLAPDSAPK